jgi:hypothetical protein
VDSDVLALYRSPGPAKRTTAETLREFMTVASAIDAREYGVVTDGTDCAAALRLAIAASITQGKALQLPAGTIRCNTAIEVVLSDYTSYQNAFCPGIRIQGWGQGRTIIDSRVANGYWLSIDNSNPHTSTFQGILGGYLSSLTIRNGASVAASGGLKLRVAYQFLVEDVHCFDLSGTGLKVECTAGDLDGSVHVVVDNCRFEICDGWGIDAAAGFGLNEISNLEISNTIIPSCGLNEAKTVTAITRANPAVVSCTAHGYANGDMVYLCGVTGMTQVDSMAASLAYTVANATADTFELSGINSSAFSVFTAGFVLPRDPKSGGIKWKGQQLRITNSGTVTCQNAGLFIPGNGGQAQDVVLQNFTAENCGGFGVQILGMRSLRADIVQVYSNQSFSPPVYAGWLIDGQTQACSDIIVSQPLVRATAAETNYTYFKGLGANLDLQSVRVKDVAYKQDGFAGQTRFSGLRFDAVPEQCGLLVLDATTIRLAPTAAGNFAAGRRAAPTTGTVRSVTGEVVAVSVEAEGISQPNTLVGGGALANNTTYNVYLYDAADTLGRWGLDINTTAPVYDTVVGREVMTGSADRIFKGRVRTDGSGQFVLSDAAWLNPYQYPGNSVGADAYWWVNSVGWLSLRTTSTLPSSSPDANYFLKPTSEEIVVFDPASVPAGGFIQADVTLTAHAANDQILSVSRAGGWGDIGVAWTTKAANTMRLTLFNGTGAPIDLASANIYVEKMVR